MAFEYPSSCPACLTNLTAYTDREVFRKTVFTLAECPACKRKVSILVGGKDGIMRDVNNDEAPVLLKVVTALPTEAEKQITGDSPAIDPMDHTGDLHPKKTNDSESQTFMLIDNDINQETIIISNDDDTETVINLFETKETGVNSSYIEPIIVAPTPPEKLPHLRWAYRGMIFGIIATICGALAWVPAVGFFYSVIGIVLGLIAFIQGIKMKSEFRNNPNKYRPSSAKMIRVSFKLGLLGWILSFVMIFICIATTIAVYD